MSASSHVLAPVEHGKSFIVMGVDPGTTRAAMVALDSRGRVVLHHRLHLRGEVPQRLAALYRQASTLLDRSRAAIVAIENPLQARNLHTADLLSRAVGIIELAAVQRRLLVLEYRPSQWRALVQDVETRYDVRQWSPDEIAACAVALRALQESIEVG